MTTKDNWYKLMEFITTSNPCLSGLLNFSDANIGLVSSTVTFIVDDINSIRGEGSGREWGR